MEYISFIFLFSFSFIFIIYIYFKHAYTYFEKRGIPFMTPSFPFGNFKKFLQGKQSFSEVFRKLYEGSSPDHPFVGVFLLQRPTLLIKDPQMIKQILVQDFNNFHDRSLRFNEKLEPLFKHLVFLSGEKWKNLRMKLTPVFTSGKIKLMFEIIKNQTENLLEYLKKNNSDNIEVKDLFTRLLTDIIASCAFGIECNSLENPNNEFRQWGKKMFEPTLKVNLSQILNSAGEWSQKLVFWHQLDPKVTKYFIEMVKETISYREKHNVIKEDLMQMLMQLKAKSGKEALSEVECAAQAFVFFVAGYETSSAMMSFVVYELARNPEIQTRLQEEIDKAFANSGVNYETINQLTYLDMVVKGLEEVMKSPKQIHIFLDYLLLSQDHKWIETLRKYPPLSILDRIVTKPIHLKWGDRSVHLEKGLKISISLLGLHHDPKYFPNPEQFDPERFSEENKKFINNYTYLPFGEGPRNCIGSRFGLMQSKVGLAMLLHRFTFNTCEKTLMEPKIKARSLVYIMDGGIFLNIKKRN